LDIKNQRGDGSLRFLEGVNAYKMDLQDEYNVSDIFKVFFFYLFLFDVGDDSRSNSFEERRHNAIMATTSKDLLGVFIGSILRP